VLYKLIVVDDEEIIRNGLTDFFNRKPELGFELVASLSDGNDTIEYLKTNPVDVVLTDIKMPGKTGLDIAKYIHDNKFNIKVVLISGYNDFEYAKKGIEYSVKYYLLKPTNFSEAKHVFGKLKESLDLEKMDKDEYLSEIQEQFFTELILGSIINKDDIINQMNELNFTFDIEYCPCAIINIIITDYFNSSNNTLSYGNQSKLLVIRNIFQKSFINEYCYKLFYNYPEMKFIVISKSSFSLSDFKSNLYSIIETIEQATKEIVGCQIKIKIENCYENIFGILKYNDLKNDVLLKERVLLLFTYMTSRNHDAANNLIESIIESIKENDLVDVRSYLLNLFSMMNNNFVMIGENLPKLSYRFDYYSIVSINNIEELGKFSVNLIRSIIDYFSVKSEIASEFSIKKSQKFIDNNFSRDISLEEVSEHVFLSPAYFCRLFKQETGENFINYLIRIRMENAVIYLKQGLKINDISEKVGFNSSKYFSKMFKKYYGISPSDYMRNL